MPFITSPNIETILTDGKWTGLIEHECQIGNLELVQSLVARWKGEHCSLNALGAALSPGDKAQSNARCTISGRRGRTDHRALRSRSSDSRSD